MPARRNQETVTLSSPVCECMGECVCICVCVGVCMCWELMICQRLTFINLPRVSFLEHVQVRPLWPLPLASFPLERPQAALDMISITEWQSECWAPGPAAEGAADGPLLPRGLGPCCRGGRGPRCRGGWAPAAEGPRC